MKYNYSFKFIEKRKKAYENSIQRTKKLLTRIIDEQVNFDDKYNDYELNERKRKEKKLGQKS